MQNTNNIDLRLLRVLAALVAERNVSRAAERLGLSQPATSHALARLRSMFDDPLLLRSRKGMVPTERAMELAREAEELLDRYERLVSPPAPFRPEATRRRFVLTATEYAEFVLLPPLLARLRAEAPGVRIDIRAPDQPRLLEWLERGEIDLRIGWVRNPTPTLRSQALFQDRLVCVACRDHPALANGLTLERYLALPHVRPEIIGRATTGRVVDEAVAAAGGELNLMLGVQNYLPILYTVAASDLIATLPERLAQAFQRRLPIRIYEPPLRLPRMRYAAYWHDRHHKDAGHQWLRRMVLEAARALPQSG